MRNANLVLGENVSISNGTIEISENGYIKLNHNSNIKNCSFSNRSYCKIGYGDLYADSCRGIKINKCNFSSQRRQTKGKCSSIDLRNCEDFIIEKIESDYTEGENIIIYEGSGIVRKCSLNSGWSGVGTAIYGTSIVHPKMGSKESKIRITNNVIRNTLAAGITINNNNVVCENNTVLFDNCTVNGPGIRLGHKHSPANTCIVQCNMIKWINGKPSGASTSNRGISIDAGDDNWVTNNIIENIPVGIASSVTNKTGTTIKRNVIKNATDFGVSIYESSDIANKCKIDENTIIMKEGTAIWVHNCSSDINKNTISFPKNHLSSEENDDRYMGIMIDDNAQVETRLTNNIIKYSNMPVKATFKGKKVTK